MQRRVLFIFLDGIGLGDRDSTRNPLAALPLQVLGVFRDSQPQLIRKGCLRSLDACMGVEGLPQSATGQASLFTGVNAARILGRHLQGFPNGRLKRLIAEHSLFARLESLGKRVTFANVYTPRFFKRRPRWISVTTTMCETAGVRLRTLEDLDSGQGLFMDFSNRYLIRQGLDVKLREPEEAGRMLIELAARYDLTLYEFFLTDLAGHRGTFEEALELLRVLDRFLWSVVQSAVTRNVDLLITSDHGNLEDKSTRSHTLNRVPLMLWGDIAELFDPEESQRGRERAHPESRGSEQDLSLADVTSRLIEYLS